MAITVPLGIALTKVKTAGIDFRLFSVFLLIGLCTDAAMFYFAQTKQHDYLLPIFKIYSLTESVFLYWFTMRCLRSGAIRIITKILLIITPVFWLFFIWLFPNLLFTDATASQVYDTIYEVAISFLSGYALLQMAEQKDGLLSYKVWILFGVFFYCFCTFFLMNFLNTVLSHQIWFLNNIFNIITYLFYSAGSWRYQEKR